MKYGLQKVAADAAHGARSFGSCPQEASSRGVGAASDKAGKSSRDDAGCLPGGAPSSSSTPSPATRWQVAGGVNPSPTSWPEGTPMTGVEATCVRAGLGEMRAPH